MDSGQPTPRDSAEFVGEMTRLQRRLYAFVLSLVLRPADAEDVLQECNLVLWRKSGEFQPGTDFATWAFRIAQLQVLAFRKKRARSRECFDDALLGRLADEAPPRFERFDLRQQALLACLRRLRPDQRSLLARRYEPGGSLKDVAAACGRPAKAVSEALRRLRETLMRCIEKRLALEGGR